MNGHGPNRRRRFPLNASVCAFLLILALPAFSASAENELPEPGADVEKYQRIVRPLLAKYCVECHGDIEAEADLTLHNISGDLLEGDNLESWRMVEERLKFGDMPPRDSDQPSNEEKVELLEWIRTELKKCMLPNSPFHEKLSLPQFGNFVDHDALFGKRLSRVYPAPPRLWRLRPEIYDATLPRLGENVSGLSNGLDVSEEFGFKDFSSEYFIDEASTVSLVGNAKKIAAALIGEKSKDRIFRELADESKPLNRELVEEATAFAFLKILDRNATVEEQQRFAAFHSQTLEGSNREIAAKALITAILMQPEVLFRHELGDGNPDAFGRVRLKQREVAFALSYALDDRPISEFFQAANQDALASSDQVAAMVRSKLQDDSLTQAANPRIMQFFREYFGYTNSTEVFKDQPAGGDHQPERLTSDLELIIQNVLRRDENVLAELLTTRKYYVDAVYRQVKREPVELQKNNRNRWSPYHTTYNLPKDWKWSLEQQPVEFPHGERAGVLTHPAWLTAWSGNFENHPVQRGKWIRTHLLGGTVPDVPIGVDARVPEQEHASFRSRLKQATKSQECWRCHQKMDPLGLVFERYDHYGRFQRFDAGEPVDATGRIDRVQADSLKSVSVNGPGEMMDVLSRSEHVEQVFVRYVFRFFLGRNETLGDANTLQDAHLAYRENGGSFRALVTSILSSDSFLLRQSTAP